MSALRFWRSEAILADPEHATNSILRCASLATVIASLMMCEDATSQNVEALHRALERVRHLPAFSEIVTRIQSYFAAGVAFYESLFRREPNLTLGVHHLALSAAFAEHVSERTYLAYMLPLLRQVHERLFTCNVLLNHLQCECRSQRLTKLTSCIERAFSPCCQKSLPVRPILYASLRACKGGTRFGVLHDDTRVGYLLAAGCDPDDACVAMLHTCVFQRSSVPESTDVVSQDDNALYARCALLRAQVREAAELLQSVCCTVSGEVTFSDSLFPVTLGGRRMEHYLADDGARSEDVPSLAYAPKTFNEVVSVQSGHSSTLQPVERWIDAMWGGSAALDRLLHAAMSANLLDPPLPQLRRRSSVGVVAQHMVPMQLVTASAAFSGAIANNSLVHVLFNVPDVSIVHRIKQQLRRRKPGVVSHEAMRTGGQWTAARDLTFALWFYRHLIRSGYRRLVPQTHRVQVCSVALRTASSSQTKRLLQHVEEALLRSTTDDLEDDALYPVGVSIHDANVSAKELHRVHGNLTSILPPIPADIQVVSCAPVTVLHRNDALEETVRVSMACALNAVRDHVLHEWDLRFQGKCASNCISFDDCVLRYVDQLNKAKRGEQTREFERHVGALDTLDALLTLTAKLPPYTLLRLQSREPIMGMLATVREIACSPMWL